MSISKLAQSKYFYLVLVVSIISPMFSLEGPAIVLLGLISTAFLTLSYQENYIRSQVSSCWFPTLVAVSITNVANPTAQTILDALPIYITIISFYCFVSLSREDLFRHLPLIVNVYTVVLAIDVVFQRLTGYDLFFRNELAFGWKSTGPYPFIYIDTYSLVAFALISYMYIKRITSSLNFYLLAGCWLLILISTGTRSAVLMLLTTPILSLFFFCPSLITRHFQLSLKIPRKLIPAFLAFIALLLLISLNSMFFYATFSTFFDRTILLINAFLALDFNSADPNRAVLWSAFNTIFSEHPSGLLFGFGLGSLLPLNAEIFRLSYVTIDDFQNVWLDIIYSFGLFGLAAIIISLLRFSKFIILPIKSSVCRLIVASMILWPFSPFSVQHKLMDIWYILNILVSFCFAFAIYQNEQYSK